MKEQNSIALDFKVARNKAGLRQIDVAHLLGVQEARISQIENGKALPTVLELATFSIIYGKQMESLLSGFIDEVVNSLIDRMQTIPPVSRELPETFNRVHSLSQLARHLEILTSTGHAGS